MTEFVRVATRHEIPDGQARCVRVNGRRIALVSLGGTIYAVDDTCTHAKASLSEGEVCGDEIVCPLHAATFDVRSGRATGPPAVDDLATYPVRISGDDVEVQV